MDEELLNKIASSTDKNNVAVQNLVAELKRQAKSGGMKFRDVQRLGDELKKLSKNAKEGGEEFKQLAQEVDKLAKSISVGKKIQEDINSTTKNLASSFFALGNAATTGTDRIQFFTESVRNFPFAGAAIADLGQSLDFNIDNFRSLASVGADFNQSLIQLRLASREAFLPLTEFTDLVASNSTVLAGLFGSVNQSTAQLASLTRAVRSDLIPEFAGLGITTENLNDFLGTFFELQRIQNRTSFLDQEATTQAIRTYGIEIDKITRLTGVQREVINDSIKAQRDDAVFNLFLRGLGEEQETELRALVAGLTNLNSAVGEAVKNILATGFPLGEFEQTLVGTTDGLLDNILALRNNEISTTQFAQSLAASSKQFANTFDPAVARAVGPINSVAIAVQSLNRQFATQDQLLTEQTLGQQNLTAAIGTTQESFRRLQSQFQGLQTNVLEALAPGLTPLLNSTTTAVNAITNGVNFISQKAPGATAAAILTLQAGKYIFDYASQVGIIATGVRIGIAGPRGLIASFRNFLPAIASAVRLLGLAVAGVAAALTTLQSISKLFSEETRASGIGGVAGAIGGAVAGRAIGGSIGAIGGPAGILIGTTIGGIIGQQLGELVQSRQVGTVGATGLPAEPASIITTVERGERVLNATETANLTNPTPDPRINTLVEANQQMVKSLNTLVGISAKTERNTENSTRKLANMSSNLV